MIRLRERLNNPAVWAIAGLGLSHFAIDWMSDSPALVIAHLRDRYHLTATTVGLWMAVFSVSASLLQVPLGWWFQRIGWLQPGGRVRRVLRFVLGLILFASIFMGLVPLGGHPGVHLTFLVLAGLAIATFHPLGAGLVYLLTERDRAFWMGVFISSGVIGFGLGPWFVGLMLTAGNGIYTLGQILIGTLMVPLVFVLFQKGFRRGMTSTPVLSTVQSNERSVRWGVIANLYILVVVREWAKLGVITYWPLLMRGAGWSDARIGFWLSFFLIPGPLLGWLVGAWADRVGGKRVLWILQWCVLVAWIGYFFLPIGLPLRLIWFVLAGTALVATSPINVVMAQRLAPQHLGLVTALMMGFAWGASGLLLPVLGRVADVLSISTMLHFPIGASIFSLVLIAFLPNDQGEA